VVFLENFFDELRRKVPTGNLTRRYQLKSLITGLRVLAG
jgi:hypothetical protein